MLLRIWRHIQVIIIIPIEIWKLWSKFSRICFAAEEQCRETASTVIEPSSTYVSSKEVTCYSDDQNNNLNKFSLLKAQTKQSTDFSLTHSKTGYSRVITVTTIHFWNHYLIYILKLSTRLCLRHSINLKWKFKKNFCYLPFRIQRSPHIARDGGFH